MHTSHVRMYVCTRMRALMHVSMHVSLHACTRMHALMHAHMHVCLHVCTPMHALMHANTHVRTYVRTYAFTHCTHVNMHRCAHMHMRYSWYSLEWDAILVPEPASYMYVCMYVRMLLLCPGFFAVAN